MVNLGWPVRHCWSALLKRVFEIEFATAAASKAEEEDEEGGEEDARRGGNLCVSGPSASPSG